MPHIADRTEAAALVQPSRARRRRASTALLGVALAASTVAAAPAGTLDDAAEQYRPYMIEEIDQALADARALHDRVVAGDLEGAKKAWLAARVGWERSEVFTSGFVPDLDEEIDAWPNALMGFHAIEAKLFGADQMNVEQETNALIFNLADLDVKIHHIQLTPQRLLNGTARLAYEVGESKAEGGESRFSGTSIDDMRYNLDGIDAAYRIIFADTLRVKNPKLDAAAQQNIAELQTVLKAPTLKTLDQVQLRNLSEELVVTLQTAAPEIGLREPTLEDLAQ